MRIVETIERILRDTGSGKSADFCVKGELSNSLDARRPFQAIKLENVDQLLIMMRDADFPHIYVNAGVFHFSAYYFHDDRFPVGRNYFMKEENLMRIATLHNFFISRSLDLPLILPTDLGKYIDVYGFEERVADFKKRSEKEISVFKRLFEGRSSATCVEDSMFLNSPGCLVCGCDKYYLMTSTLSSSKGFMLGFNLCDEHMELAKNERSLLDYLAKLLQGELPFQFVRFSAREHFELVLQWLPQELGCEVEKKSENTAYLVRPSGLKCIFRIDSPSNYAYMIINKNGKEVARIDSADHHDIEFGPDHIHVNLTKKKKSVVESSFTTGSPLIDTKKIRQLIALKEAEMVE